MLLRSPGDGAVSVASLPRLPINPEPSLPPPFLGGTSDSRARLDVGAAFREAQPTEAGLPRMERLPTPDPETGSRSDYETHEVFEDEHGEVRRSLILAVQTLACLSPFPGVAVVVFVGITTDDAQSGDRVQDGHYPDADHELLQLVSPRLSLLLNQLPQPEQRDESGDQEGRTDQQEHAKRGENENTKVE